MKNEKKKASPQSYSAENILNYKDESIQTDPFGSYTGVSNFDPFDDIPVQDVDDL